MLNLGDIMKKRPTPIPTQTKPQNMASSSKYTNKPNYSQYMNQNTELMEKNNYYVNNNSIPNNVNSNIQNTKLS